MPHFDSTHVAVDLFSFREEVIDSCCDGDYKLVMSYIPSRPDHILYSFIGIPPGKDRISKGTLYTSSDIYDVFDFIAKTFPKMKPDDWDTLHVLNKDVLEAGKVRSIRNNANTAALEDRALDNLVSFLKDHGLL